MTRLLFEGNIFIIMLTSPASIKEFQSIYDEGSLRQAFRRVEAEPKNEVVVNAFKGIINELVSNQTHLFDTLVCELPRLARTFVHDLTTRLWCWKIAARAFAQYYESLSPVTVLHYIHHARCPCLWSICLRKGIQDWRPRCPKSCRLCPRSSLVAQNRIFCPTNAYSMPCIIVLLIQRHWLKASLKSLCNNDHTPIICSQSIANMLPSFVNL